MKRQKGRRAKRSRTTDPMIGRKVDLTIDEIGSSGDGVGHVEGRAIYVPLALSGDDLTVRLSARRGQGYAADLVEGQVLMPRQQPICQHFGRCGGCRLQHVPPIDYREWKVARIRSALASRGLADVDIKPLIDGHPHRRRRLRLAFRQDGAAVVLGFRRRFGRDIVNVEACPIALPSIVDAVNPIRRCLDRLDLAVEGGELSITAADNGLDILIHSPTAPGLSDREALAALAEAADVARLAWRPEPVTPAEPIAARRQPMVDFGSVSVGLPMGAFLQATREAEQAIRDAVGKALGDAETIVDLFAGCGALSLPFAHEGRRVRAMERDPAMIQTLNAVAKGASLGGRIAGIARDLDHDPLTAKELSAFDALIIDPPRAGAGPQARAIAAGQGPRHIAMVSCNPSTFARDARILTDAGYRLAWVQPIDAFLYAAEIELVGAFERTKAS